MSTNKSVLAAQRRRVGQEMAPNPPIRSPQPSINSAQMFNGQGRQMPMPGQRQPAQQPQQQQQQMYQQQQQQQMYQQQHQQQQHQQQQQQESATSKLTVAQAITLITLRLGALESKMMEMPSSDISSELGNNIVAVDKGFMDSIMERLESLEKQTQSQIQLQSQSQNSSVSQSIVTDVTVLKQQFEPVKQAAVQTKNAVVNLTKESKDTKSNVDVLRKELNETKDLLNSLQSMVIDNNSKLLSLSLSGDFVSMSMTNINESMQYLGDLDLELQNVVELEGEGEGEGELESEGDNEIVGTNLKEMIENEINLDS